MALIDSKVPGGKILTYKGSQSPTKIIVLWRGRQLNTNIIPMCIRKGDKLKDIFLKM